MLQEKFQRYPWLEEVHNDEFLASSRGSKKPRSSHRSRVSIHSKTVSRTSSQRNKELMLAKLSTEKIDRQNEASICLLEIKQRLEEVQIREEYRKRYVAAKSAGADLEDDSD